MLNRSGVTKEVYGSINQILADVENQSSVGCIVDKDLGVQVGNKKLVKAGTPININLMNIQTKCKGIKAATTDPVAAAVPMNAVLLHDVDVTNGDANGTALIFGFVNVNRVDADVATKITAAMAVEGASPLIVFSKQ